MKTITIIKYVFTLFGLGLLCGAFLFYINTHNFLKSALTVNGTVVELVSSRSSDSTTYRPVVEFKTLDGQLIEFTSSSGSNPPSYSRGEIVDVLYQASSPDSARINGFFSLWGGCVILGAMGAVFFAIGFGIIVSGRLKNKKIEFLKKHGTPVKAKFQSVDINGSLQVNGKSPYQIIAQWKNPNTSELHIFKSENLWFDPTDHIVNDEITVLIEPSSPKKYYVDVSFLPKIAD